MLADGISRSIQKPDLKRIETAVLLEALFEDGIRAALSR